MADIVARDSVTALQGILAPELVTSSGFLGYFLYNYTHKQAQTRSLQGACGHSKSTTRRSNAQRSSPNPGYSCTLTGDHLWPILELKKTGIPLKAAPQWPLFPPEELLQPILHFPLLRFVRAANIPLTRQDQRCQTRFSIKFSFNQRIPPDNRTCQPQTTNGEFGTHGDLVSSSATLPLDLLLARTHARPHTHSLRYVWSSRDLLFCLAKHFVAHSFRAGFSVRHPRWVRLN